MSHKVTTVWKEDLIFTSNNPNGHNFNLGQSEKANDPNKPLGPKAVMLSSLAACSGLDVVSILEKMKVKLEGFKIEVEGELTDEHPKIYHIVTVGYYFTGNNLNEEKIKRAVQLSVEKYCGVIEMFRQFAEVKTTIKFYNI